MVYRYDDDSGESWRGRDRVNWQPAPTAAPMAPAAPAPAQQDPSADVPDYGSFSLPSYEGAASPSYQFGSVPTFDAPQFVAPSFAQAQNEPGYQFRLAAGTDALQNSAAARGVLRTGGTLKDILGYGQKFGAEEYANVFNRAMQAYGAKYQAAKDMFAPKFADYQNRFGAEQSRAMAEFQRQMDLYNANLQGTLAQENFANNALQTPMPTFPGGG